MRAACLNPPPLSVFLSPLLPRAFVTCLCQSVADGPVRGAGCPLLAGLLKGHGPRAPPYATVGLKAGPDRRMLAGLYLVTFLAQDQNQDCARTTSNIRQCGWRFLFGWCVCLCVSMCVYASVLWDGGVVFSALSQTGAVLWCCTRRSSAGSAGSLAPRQAVGLPCEAGV